MALGSSKPTCAWCTRMNKSSGLVKTGLGLLLGLLLSGCSNSFGQSTYDKTWYLAFSAPAYM